MSDAGLIVIGNEVLAGRVEEQNAKFLIARLRKIGVVLARVVFLRDDVDAIAREVRMMAKDFAHVFTSGGIGSTHDDVTLRGVAEAFGLGLESHAALESALRSRYPDASPATLRLAIVPTGAELIESGMASFPLLRVRNVYVFPGVPEFFRSKWLAVESRFETTPFCGYALYLNVGEEEIADLLSDIDRMFEDVEFGSYPRFDAQDYKVKITLQSKKQPRLEAARTALKARLTRGWLVKEEPC
ncbi:MAG: competence/damage-inducible protein A [Deltaproteobacteria bacterium]|nr:competence/damage-inducible protein A [Deltaproteobacteria bacterium]